MCCVAMRITIFVFAYNCIGCEGYHLRSYHVLVYLYCKVGCLLTSHMLKGVYLSVQVKQTASYSCCQQGLGVRESLSLQPTLSSSMTVTGTPR